MTAQAELTEDEMSDSTVELGDVAFDPVAEQDFRLSVEGTSGTGKSNTLAVILEDLADVPLPTLIIERLGALTPVRLKDDDILVVGARDEEGIDIPVALEDLDTVGEWVLDRGLKILVDISTYADYEDEKSREHLAAAKALRSLNDRAHEKYRAGDRTKSLLIVDEAHILAPKDSAPEPELDDHVKRCRGQLIKASTEGGNKGITIVVGYQRRAFLHNGVIQLAQDFVAHRPGDEDIDRTADALRCSENELASLGTGEILARGASITDGDPVGPTPVRKRRSPDPREEHFDLPEVSDDLAGALDEMRDEVEAERRRREERQDELERLREENERLRERVDELEQELADTDRLASALDNLGSNGGAAQDVGEGVADLQGRVDELKGERDQLEADLEALQDEKAAVDEENKTLQERVADLEAEVQEVRSAFDSAAGQVEDLAETFEVDVNLATGGAAATDVPDDVEDLRADLASAQERVQDLEAENERLRARAEQSNGEQLEPLTSYGEFLEDDDVRKVIDEAKSSASNCSPKHIKGVIAAVLDAGGPVSYEEIGERINSRTNEIGSAATLLEDMKVVEKEKRDGQMHVDLNVDGLNEVREAAARRRKTEELMDSL